MFSKEDFYKEILLYNNKIHSEYSIVEVKEELLNQLKECDRYCLVKDYKLECFSLCLDISGELFVIDLCFDKVKNFFSDNKIIFSKKMFFVSQVEEDDVYDIPFDLPGSLDIEKILTSIYNHFINDNAMKLKFLAQNNIIF